MGLPTGEIDEIGETLLNGLSIGTLDDLFVRHPYPSLDLYHGDLGVPWIRGPFLLDHLGILDHNPLCLSPSPSSFSSSPPSPRRFRVCPSPSRGLSSLASLPQSHSPSVACVRDVELASPARVHLLHRHRGHRDDETSSYGRSRRRPLAFASLFAYTKSSARHPDQEEEGKLR